MSDLRKAAEDVLEAWSWDDSEPRNKMLRERIQALRQALAQPEQEPVWSAEECDRVVKTLRYIQGIAERGEGRAMRDDETLEQFVLGYVKKLEQPEQEPVKYKDDEVIDGVVIKSVYAAPPKREWQNLTDDEIKEIVGPWGDTPIKGYTRKLFDQIEAKLKEKNT